MMSLNEIDRPTDKFTLGYVDTFYDPLFAPIRNKVTNLLEIGIQYGHSLLMWRDFFPNANVYGVDIDTTSMITNENRVVTICTNAYDSAFVDTLKDGHFDIVIDDGPHTFDSMVFFLDNYLDKVKPGGYLVLEDIVDPTWTSSLMSRLSKPYIHSATVYDMRSRQRTVDLTNRWAGGLDVIVVQKRG